MSSPTDARSRRRQALRVIGGVFVIVAISLPLAASAALVNGFTGFPAKLDAHFESSTTPNRHGQRIFQPAFGTPQQTGQATTVPFGQVRPAAAQPQPSLGPNLIPNPSLETAGSNDLPQGWHKSGYGSNARTFAYPATPAEDGASAIGVSVANYSSGDAKWFFDDIPVTAGHTYRLSDWSKGSSSVITVRFQKSDGSFIYKDVATPAASADYQQNSVDFIVPDGVTSLTVFHLLNSNGSLVTDNYSLQEVTGGADTGLISNGSLEVGSGSPVGWFKGGWGSNTRSFSYPAKGVGGSRAAQVTISSYSSGDAKWYFQPVPVSSGIYTYTDSYAADVPSILTVQFVDGNGNSTYKDIAKLAVASTFTTASAQFSVPPSTKSISVFHLINQKGSLTIDNASLAQTGTASGIFQTGAVTLRFDDGWESQYQNAFPIMQQYGLKGTFYIVSQQLADDQFSGFMSIAEIKNLYQAGDEIGAHTRTHPYLTSLSPKQQQDEIQGSRQDILSWNVGPVSTFAYPYGDYNATTLQIVKNAGFSSAAATIGGLATQTSDPYQLEHHEVDSSVTAAQAKQWIDQAAADHGWLILTFHDVSDNPPDTYATTPAIFSQIAAYIAQKKIPVVTVSEGASQLAH